jgi:predicted nucleic acid-binding protein
LILVDSGPFVALFDPQDGEHARCAQVLKTLREPLVTTIPVLTEAFHILDPASQGSARLRDFVLRGGVSAWFLDQAALERSFELMAQYADRPMDLADASLIAAAEALATRKIFTLDRADFSIYRVRRGHRQAALEMLGLRAGGVGSG